ncbi:4Fe-4S binding protein [Candidatus Bathyarchaeota archaeon]|nr:4Fe-4S binding protein [Candidatus Bathyarchaeota archaeon]
MGKRNPIIVIDYGKCPPCSGLICIGVCPLAVLEEGANGKPKIVDEASCNRCDVCANLCPEKAININQDEINKTK